MEFQVAQARPDQLPTLIHCAYFAHKYNISPLFLASLEAIVHIAEPIPALDSKIYLALLELSTLCELERSEGYRYTDAINHAVQLCWIRHFSREFTDLSMAMDAI